MRHILIIFMMVVCFSTEVLAATPSLNFSDITSGPNNGLSDASVTNQGAIVTVWGNNLGAVQGSSKVYVGGVEAAKVYYWGNADRSSGPADLYSYHQMQEVSFAVPSTAPSGVGPIKVTVNGTESNALPFTVRTGNIFFISPAGNDSNSGSWTSPLRTVTGAANRMVAGDVLYLRGGNYQGFIVGGKIGTEANPFAVIAYPSERVVLTPYPGNIKYVVSNNPLTVSEYWHFSKLRTEVQYMGFGYLFKGERIIANEITNQAGYCAGEGVNGVSGAISSAGGGQTADGILMLGNYIHDYGCDPTTMPGHDTSSLQHTYYVSNRTGTPKSAYEIGWSFTKDSHAPSGLHNYDQSACGGWTGELKIHDNVVVNQRGGGINWDSNCNSTAPLTATVKIYNNLLINTGLGPIAYDPNTHAATLNGNAIRIQGGVTSDNSTIFLENNTVIGWSDPASDAYGINPSGLSFPSNAGATMTVQNNLMTSTNNRPFVDATGKTPGVRGNNLWYSSSNSLLTPPWDVLPLSADPQLDSSFAPLATSPVLSAGVPIAYVQKDSRSNARSNVPAIGALEYVSATASNQVFILAYIAGANGTISGSTQQSVNSGGSGTTVTAVANSGYHFASWSDGQTTAARNDANVIANISVTANFAANSYALTYTAGTNGTISGSSPQSVNSGDSGTTVTAVANPGFHFASWSDGVSTAARTDANVTSNISVAARFAADTYTLTYAAGANGTIIGSTLQVVSSGVSGLAVTAVANSGYHFVSWSDGLTSAARTDQNVSSSISVTASFAINITYTLAYGAGANGTISGTTLQAVNFGMNGTPVTAVANSGFQFVSWSDGVATAARSDLNVTSNISVTAVFIDITLPVIKSVSLTNGNSNVNIKASATDNVAVSKMQLFIDNSLQMESPNGALSYVWSVTYHGTHSITVKAYDAAGNVRSQSLNINK